MNKNTDCIVKLLNPENSKEATTCTELINHEQREEVHIINSVISNESILFFMLLVAVFISLQITNKKYRKFIIFLRSCFFLISTLLVLNVYVF